MTTLVLRVCLRHAESDDYSSSDLGRLRTPSQAKAGFRVLLAHRFAYRFQNHSPSLSSEFRERTP